MFVATHAPHHRMNNRKKTLYCPDLWSVVELHLWVFGRSTIADHFQREWISQSEWEREGKKPLQASRRNLRKTKMNEDEIWFFFPFRLQLQLLTNTNTHAQIETGKSRGSTQTNNINCEMQHNSPFEVHQTRKKPFIYSQFDDSK